MNPPDWLAHRHVVIHRGTEEDFPAQQSPSFIQNGALGRSTFEATSNVVSTPKKRRRKQRWTRIGLQHDTNSTHLPNPGSSGNVTSRGAPVSFQTLPREIRDQIYAELVGICPVKPEMFRRTSDRTSDITKPPPTKFRALETNILRLSKQTSQEAAMVLYQGNRWIYICLHSRTSAWVDRLKGLIGHRYKCDLTTAEKQGMKVLFAVRISESLDCSGQCKMKRDFLQFEEITASHSKCDPSESDPFQCDPNKCNATTINKRVTKTMLTRISETASRGDKRDKEDFLIPAEGADNLIRAIITLNRQQEHWVQNYRAHMKITVTTGQATGQYLGRDRTIRNEIVMRFRQIGIFDEVDFQGAEPDMWKPFSSPQEATAALQMSIDKARAFFHAGRWSETISAYTTAYFHFHDLYAICKAAKKRHGTFELKPTPLMGSFYSFLSLEGECNIGRSWAALQVGKHSSKVDHRSALIWAESAMESPFLGSRHLLNCYTAKSLALAGLGNDKQAFQALECMRVRLARLLPEGKIPALDNFILYGGLEFEMAPWKWQEKRCSLRQYKTRQFWKAWKLLWQPVIDFEADPIKYAAYKMAGPHGPGDSIPWFFPVQRKPRTNNGIQSVGYYRVAAVGETTMVELEEFKRNEPLMLDWIFSPLTKM